jgi:hypothetical protein
VAAMFRTLKAQFFSFQFFFSSHFSTQNGTKNEKNLYYFLLAAAICGGNDNDRHSARS